MDKNAVIIVAGGRGQRAATAGGGPKQYRSLGGRSVIDRTIAAFRAHDRIYVILPVIHDDDRELFESVVEHTPKMLAPVTGGATRQQSVWAGLQALAQDYPLNVLIHDAARPFVSADTISAVLDAIGEGTGALPGCALSDTLKRADPDGYVLETIPRESVHGAQTPQGFRFADIFAAHGKFAEAGRFDFSDDAGIAEAAGMRMRLVPGSSRNMKITTAEDFAMADLFAGATASDIRTGNGYDVHALGEGGPIILCGVEIPADFHLMGHSDADVGLHALTDAVLGACGAGDIGHHFPPSDQKWRGASSDQFLAHAVGIATNLGGILRNLDVTLICETPKIGPYRDMMRERIASIAKLEIGRVSVKATTNERLGFIGRQEGIAAIATATLAFTQAAPGG